MLQVTRLHSLNFTTTTTSTTSTTTTTSTTSTTTTSSTTSTTTTSPNSTTTLSGTTTKDQSSKSWILFVLLAVAVVFILGIAIACYVYMRRYQIQSLEKCTFRQAYPISFSQRQSTRSRANVSEFEEKVAMFASQTRLYTFLQRARLARNRSLAHCSRRQYSSTRPWHICLRVSWQTPQHRHNRLD